MLHESQRKFARSRVPQADFITATPAGVAANWKQFLRRDKNFVNHQVLTDDNREEATGVEQATEETITVHDTGVSCELAISSEEVGRDLLLAFGNVATTQPDVTNAPTVRRHVFKPMDVAVTRQLPAMSLVEIIGAGLNRLIPSLVAEGFSLKGDGVARIAETLGLAGSGEVVTPSGFANAAAITDLADLHFFTNSQVKLTIADAGTLSNAVDYGAVKRLESWEFNVANTLLKEEGYRPGAGRFLTANDPTSGALRSELLVGARAYTGGFLARFSSQSDELAALRSKKKLDVLIELTGARIGNTVFNHKLTIKATRASYDTVELGAKNGLMTVQIKPKFMFDAAAGVAASVELVNETVSYVS